MILEIPNPCHENWADMSPESQGRFCQSCQKTVVDFSEMNDKQVAIYFEQHENENLCGRFKTTQINRNLTESIEIIRPNRHPAWKYMMWSVLAVSSLTGCQEVFKQENSEKTQVERITLGGARPAFTIIKGEIRDKCNIIADAHISLVHSNFTILSDSTGQFEIKLPYEWSTKNIELLVESKNHKSIHKTVETNDFGNLVVIYLETIKDMNDVAKGNTCVITTTDGITGKPTLSKSKK